MTNSQQFIPIESVNNDYFFLKDGSVGLLFSVSAVNFALLFETEQISIINSFAGLLNSLSFPIQIVIYSKILDVSSYLNTVDKALAKQTNPLLKTMTIGYRSFVEKSIKDNNVLDKQFYVCIKATPLEIGLFPSGLNEKLHKAAIILTPRRDHLAKQLNRLGLKTKQLNSREIIKLFYDIYNPAINTPPPKTASVTQKVPQTELPARLRVIKTELNREPVKPVQIPKPPLPPPPPPSPLPPQTQPPIRVELSSPFIVEELPDEV